MDLRMFILFDPSEQCQQYGAFVLERISHRRWGIFALIPVPWDQDVFSQSLGSGCKVHPPADAQISYHQDISQSHHLE